jgi:hypothetical protein
MFDRPTRKARKTTVLAGEEAGRFARGYIGTEHMNEGVASRILSTLGVGPNEVGREISRVLKR